VGWDHAHQVDRATPTDVPGRCGNLVEPVGCSVVDGAEGGLDGVLGGWFRCVFVLPYAIWVAERSTVAG
jgi:hypothetical protein